MIQTITIRTIIILFILVVLIVVVAYFLKKKLLEDDTIPVSSRNNKTIEDLRHQDLKDTVTNIRNSTDYVPEDKDSEKLEEYSARKSIEDEEII